MSTLPFVALDVETSSRTPRRVCSVGACAVDETGTETSAFYSLVAVTGPVRFTRVHRLTATELADAPSWPEVWSRLRPLLLPDRPIVAFRAAFDRGALLSMCARHGIAMPRLRFTCVAELARRRLGADQPLNEALRALGIPFPGQPHHALADARAAAALFLACQT